MKTFDLFAELNQKENPDAFIYRCGYYIINKRTNKNKEGNKKDVFHTIYLNALLKVVVIEYNNTEYFNVYKMRDLTDAQINDISIFALDDEDINEGDIEQIMNIESFDILRPETWKLKGRIEDNEWIE